MAKGKDNRGRLQVFKGREARLNKAIFHILALKSPQTIYEIAKDIRTIRQLKNTKYTNVNRRMRVLEESGYLEEVGTRETQAGFQAALYQLTTRAYLAMLLAGIDMENFVKEADEALLTTALGIFYPASSTLRH